MGTPCRCCGKVVCTSQEIRFDHDRYNYNGSIAFVHITQTISHNIDNGGYQQVSQEEYFFQDEETIACNFSVEHEATLTDPDGMPSSPPTMVKTVTSIVRKFVLRYSIGDVFDWGESNREDHLFINSIFIRGGESESNFTRIAPTDPIEVPGIGSGSRVDAKGKLYIASGRNIDPPQSMEDWNNLARGKPSYNFDHNDQDEIFINQEDIDENNDYYVLVECPESDTMVKWGDWFGGAAKQNGVTKRAFIELRRITDIETCDKLPALQDHKIEKKEDLDDWHTLFSRTADGTYVSKNKYMDKELNFGDFFKSDFDNKFFLFCGELQLGVMNPDGGQYLDLLYKIEYDREAVYVSNVDFPTSCSGPDDDRFTSDSVTAEITDPLNTSEKIKITKSKSELGEAPTEILNPLHSTSRTGDYTHATYEFTPPYNANVHRFKYNVVGGEDRFNGDDYILQEMISDYRDCENIKFLKIKNLDGTWGDRDPECPALHDYVSFSNNYSGGLTGGYPLKDILKRTAGSINGLFIRPCVIESSKALLLSEGPDRRIFDTDIDRVYNYVPHYGEYEPSRIRFIIRNYEFYPYKLKLNDINDACPKECIPTEHIPEWQLLSSSFACAGSPAIINEMTYGANGGLSLNSGADIFACCAKLSSVRQLKSCMGKYSINTSYAMRVANYVASSPSVWDFTGKGVPTYPRCSEFHRPEDQLSFPNVGPGCSFTFTNRDLIHIGTDDICYDGSLNGGGAYSSKILLSMSVCHDLPYMDYSSLFPSFVTPHFAGGWNVRFVGDDEGRSVTYVGSAGYYQLRGLYSEDAYLVPSFAPFSERRRAGQNRDIIGTVARSAQEYSTGQLEYAKTCLEKSLDVEGYEIENEFAEEHNICVNEVSFGETFSLDKEIQRGKSDSFNARQQSDVVIKDPSCGEGLRWRVDTDNVGVYETLFDYDSDEDVSHACYFYEKGQLDLIYQQYVPAIEFAKGREAGRKMRSIADCVAGYLTTFNYWYQIAGTSPEDDIIIALRPEDDGYFETEIRSDQSPVTILEIKKLEGDLVEGGEEIFVVQTGEFEIRNQFFTGEVIELKVNIGDDVQEGQVIMLTKFGDTIREVLSTKDGEITEIKEIGPIERRDVLAKVITKNSILCPPFIEGAIRTIDVEVGEIVSSTRKVMATISNTITYPAGSYVKVKPNGEFEAPFDNHSMYQNENHYEVKDEVKIEIDGVWAKGRPAEGKRNILPDNAGIPSDITHEGEDGYKFTFYTTGIPSTYAYDYGVKDDKGVELGSAPYEFFSDEFVPVFDEFHGRFREKSPLTEDGIMGRKAGECGFSDTHMDFGDDVFETEGSNPYWCDGTIGGMFGDGSLPPCGYITEKTITKGDYYKTAPGEIIQGTTSVTVEAPQSDIPDQDGKPAIRATVVFRCYDAPNPAQGQGVNSTCRDAQGDLYFCDPCSSNTQDFTGGGDVGCTYHETMCPGNYGYRFYGAGFNSGTGLWMTTNGDSQTLEFATSSRQATEGGWDYAYNLGDSADASYGETETYRCIKDFVTLNTADGNLNCLGGSTYPRAGNFDMNGVEIDGSCLVPTDDETPCPDEEKNYNIGSTITATYRKIVLKSKFNKCGDDRLPNLNYSHKDLVDTTSADKKSFPQAVITKSVALSQHEQSLDDYDLTEEQKQKINDKLSELDKKYMRGDVDAPVNVTSAEVDNLCGTGKKFIIEREKGEVVKTNVRCKPENYVPNLHAEKFGVLVDHGDKVQAFYDAVSDAALSVPKDFFCGRKESQAEKILNNYLYGSLRKRCSERMDGAYRYLANAWSQYLNPSSQNTGDIQVQYGLRFITPYYCTAYEINNGLCPEDPENVCTQVDENKPLPVPNSDIEKVCGDLLGQFALDLMGYVPPENVFLTKGRMIKPILPSALDSSDTYGRYGEGINPVLKAEVTKKMCPLKDYSFTIGD